MTRRTWSLYTLPVVDAEGRQAMGRVERIWIVIAGLNGAMAVAAGAWASHGLAADPQAQGWARLAGEYQLWHALALAGAALLAERSDGAARIALRCAGWLYVTGIVFFSGSLYALATIGPLPFGPTAPVGGTAMILGWLALAVSVMLPGWRRR